MPSRLTHASRVVTRFVPAPRLQAGGADSSTHSVASGGSFVSTTGLESGAQEQISVTTLDAW